jgi:hypothetical protein
MKALFFFLLAIPVFSQPAQMALPSTPYMAHIKIEEVTDSIEVMNLPALCTIERIMIVIDSAIADVSSISIGIRGESTNNLFNRSTFPSGDGRLLPYSEGSEDNNVWYHNEMPRECVFHYTGSGTPVGQLRIYFYVHFYGEHP